MLVSDILTIKIWLYIVYVPMMVANIMRFKSKRYKILISTAMIAMLITDTTAYSVSLSGHETAYQTAVSIISMLGVLVYSPINYAIEREIVIAVAGAKHHRTALLLTTNTATMFFLSLVGGCVAFIMINAGYFASDILMLLQVNMVLWGLVHGLLVSNPILTSIFLYLNRRDKQSDHKMSELTSKRITYAIEAGTIGLVSSSAAFAAAAGADFMTCLFMVYLADNLILAATTRVLVINAPTTAATTQQNDSTNINTNKHMHSLIKNRSPNVEKLELEEE